VKYYVLAGAVGIVCLLLSVRLAHASLQHKLKSRKQVKISTEPVDEFNEEKITAQTNSEVELINCV